MTVLVVMAMAAEAEPIAEALGLEETDRPVGDFLPVRWFEGRDVWLALNGPDRRYHVDSIGTTAAALTTLRAIERSDPSWVVSAGTAGGFADRGGSIGQVVLARGPVIHHDRRVPLAGFEEYAAGSYPSADLGDLADRLGFTNGPCSSGDSLDAPSTDLAAMAVHGTLAKDMEAAAVARVAELTGRPFTALKVITDIVDGPRPTAEEFVENLHTASARLAEALPRLLAELPRYRQDRPS